MGNKNLKQGNWSIEKVYQKLKENHEQENTYNKENSDIDKKIKSLLIRKSKVNKMVSKNMKYRIILINILTKVKEK